MATYVTSDVHGDFEALQSVLKQACFSKKDKLYVIGDIADRGRDFYKIFTFIKNSSNIELIMGNHEYNMMNFIKDVENFERKDYDYCLTYVKLLDAKTFYRLQDSVQSVARECGESNTMQVFKSEILPFLEKLEYHKIVEVNGKKFLLVHGGVDYNLPLEENTNLMFMKTREPFNSLDLPYYGYTIIHGHTNIQVIKGGNENGEVYFRKHKISIDGGASTHNNGRLNLLRLEDMKVFYEKSINYKLRENSSFEK